VFASGGQDATILLWEVPAGKKGQPLGEPGRLENAFGTGVSSLAFSPDGKILAAGMNDLSRPHRTIVLWDAATGRERPLNP
jgi:WD40 repeat protein